MSNKLVKEERLIQPTGRTVMNLTVYENGMVNLQSPLPPDEVSKLLMNTMVGLIFQHTEMAIEDLKKDLIFKGVAEAKEIASV